MTISVLAFAQLKSVFEADALSVCLEQGATVGDLLRQLEQRYPALAPWLKTIRVAVNREYAGLETPLHEGDEVALIPPVSGG